MKRGQAALEFLTTYGWAFLVILVMIGALAYFGVINPNRFLPERCNFQQELGCDDFQLSDNSGAPELRMFVRNNLGTTMNGVRLAVQNTADGSSPTICDAGNISVQIPSGGITQIICDAGLGNLPAVGDKVKFNINGTYTPAGGQFQKSIAGEVFAVLQD